MSKQDAAIPADRSETDHALITELTDAANKLRSENARLLANIDVANDRINSLSDMLKGQYDANVTKGEECHSLRRQLQKALAELTSLQQAQGTKH
jgi:flagellar motility protein MotE (MotC chaperone)